MNFKNTSSTLLFLAPHILSFLAVGTVLSQGDVYNQPTDGIPSFPPTPWHQTFKTPSGFQWTTPVAIDTSTPNVSNQSHSVLVVDDNGNLAAAWKETQNGGSISQILFERSTDKGQTWIRSIAYGFSYIRNPRDLAFDRLGNVWLLWTSSTSEFAPFYLNLSKSTDNGQSFTTLFTSLEYAAPFFQPKLAIDKSNNVFLLWDDQQFKLTRFAGGNPGQRIDTEIPNDTLSVGPFCSLITGPNHNIYCAWTGTRNVGPGQNRTYAFCSTSRDTGSTFAVTNRVDTSEVILPATNSSSQQYPSITVDTTGCIHVAYSRPIGFIDSTSLLVATSLDNGNTFRSPTTVLELGTNTNPSVCVDVQNGLNVLWPGNGGTFFSRSTNTGQTFSDPIMIGGGLADLNTDSSGNLFTTLDTHRRAIMFTKTNILLTTPENQLMPQFVELTQNFPNPFNPQTTITFFLDRQAKVRLGVYDVLGRTIEELVNTIRGTGTHQVVWTPTSISSGVYFYRLDVQDDRGTSFSVTRKLIYLR